VNGHTVIVQGDARQLPLPDDSVDLIITSPPYWRQRDYHVADQIGREATMGEYIDALIGCTREWLRVLKPAGSLFVNMGDKYSERSHGPNRGRGTRRGPQGDTASQSRGPFEKSLLDLPARYSVACADQLGLRKRAEIIWDKPNPVPESVTDRVARSHEHLFHFTSQRFYYSATDEIRERATHRPGRPGGTSYRAMRQPGEYNTNLADALTHPLGPLPRSVWRIPAEPLVLPASLDVGQHYATFPTGLVRPLILAWSPREICTGCGQGRRPVTEVTYSDVRTNGPGHTERRAAEPQALTYASGQRARRSAHITAYACSCATPDAPTRPGVVLDPCAGTGTTMLVAAAFGRTGIGTELAARFCKAARWRCADRRELARALDVPRPAPVADEQAAMF
jgi:DNA modification methylase